MSVSPPEEPLTRADLKRMSSAEIVDAHAAGRLDHLLAGEGQVAGQPPATGAGHGADQDARQLQYATLHERMRAMTSAELVHALNTTDLQAQLLEERRAGIR